MAKSAQDQAYLDAMKAAQKAREAAAASGNGAAIDSANQNISAVSTAYQNGTPPPVNPTPNGTTTPGNEWYAGGKYPSDINGMPSYFQDRSNEYKKNPMAEQIGALDQFNNVLQDKVNNYQPQPKTGGMMYTQPVGQPKGITPIQSTPKDDLPAYTDMTDLISQLSEAQKQQRLADLEKAKNQSLSALDAEKATIAPMYYDKRNNESSQSQLGAKNFAEFMAGRNQTNSGLSGLAQLMSAGRLQGNLGLLNRQETADNSDIARRTTDVNSGFASDVASANAAIMAQALQNKIDEARRVDELKHGDYWAGKDFGLQEGALTGMYNGAPTLAGKQFDWQKIIDEAGLTGLFNGSPTWQRQLDEAGLTGMFKGSPTWGSQMDMANLLGTFGGQRTMTGQRLDQDILDNNRRFGLDEAGVTGYYNNTPTMARQQQDFNNNLDIADRTGNLNFGGETTRTMAGQQLDRNVSDADLQRQIDTIGQYSGNYQAEINRRMAINPNDPLIPYLKQARQEKIANQQSLADAQAKAEAAGQKETFDNAMALWKQYGVATPDIAQILGVPPGAKTADYDIDSRNANTSAKNADTAANKAANGGSANNPVTFASAKSSVMDYASSLTKDVTDPMTGKVTKQKLNPGSVEYVTAVANKIDSLPISDEDKNSMKQLVLGKSSQDVQYVQNYSDAVDQFDKELADGGFFNSGQNKAAIYKELKDNESYYKGQLGDYYYNALLNRYK